VSGVIVQLIRPNQEERQEAGRSAKPAMPRGKPAKGLNPIAPPQKPLWVQWWPAQALDGMFNLTAMEELAYRRILDMIFKTDDQLFDDDDVMPTATKVGRQWRKVKAGLIAKRKIALDGGFIRNARATQTCESVRAYREQKSAAATASHQSGNRLKNNKTSPADAASPAPAPAGSGEAGADSDAVQRNASFEARDASAKPLKSNEPNPAGASASYQLPLSVSANADTAPAGAEESAEEAIRSRLWGEGRAILARLCPEPGREARSALTQAVGFAARELGKGAEGAARAVQLLRDVEADAAAGKLGDFALAANDDARALALKSVLYAKSKARAKAGGSRVNGAHRQQPESKLAWMAGDEPPSPPPSGSGFIDSFCDEVPL
jgi:uncharacterized protein YdaU (DUF1376 family)